MEASIQVVDFQKLSSDQEELKKLREACEKYGCFRIINHPVPPTLMVDMKLVAKHLHDLPRDIKKRNKSAILPEDGYVSLSVTSPVYEGLGIYDMHSSPHEVQDFFSQLDVSPHDRQIIEAYGQAVHDLAASLAQKLARTLGIEDINFKDWPSFFRIMKYNFSPETMGSVGAHLHSDTGFITILQDDETVSGLEMVDDSNTFKTVPPKSGSFFCIIGDVGRAWSNGKFQNAGHRVICKEPNARYSLAIFMLSPRDGHVETPTKLVDVDHTQLYRPFKFKEIEQIKNQDLREFNVTTGNSTPRGLDQFLIG
ncbi:2-oxoglutarate-dependent dioxygenase DAO [Cajanus cajan]|uniref:Gibberellin 2-beta-dioxygenase 7 n=1 Tax=Cajanus cajan TaxID=3821 RepID=A0A151R7W8_CAJCA|nr:2-oxoglutarate-dependent dioxygenase DAO [Cajanus cajan]KYP38599.1 Gibberellin 2-beta-dioxygenase 7 [Cajanus cajan]